MKLNIANQITYNFLIYQICSPFSAASQTDLCSENFPIGAREMSQLRLKYDEWRKRVKEIQEKLASLEERVSIIILFICEEITSLLIHESILPFTDTT